MRDVNEQRRWGRRLRDLGFSIRTHLRGLLASGVKDLTVPVAQEGGDTIYALDRDVEHILISEIQAWSEPLLLIAEGMGSDGRCRFGHEVEQLEYRLIVDPIDGTRGLMYDKRSAWFLAAIAPDRGEATSLSDVIAATMVELPTSKAAWADDFVALSDGGVEGWRRRCETEERKELFVRPSAAANLKDGFAQVANFFPGTKVLASELMERIVEATLGTLRPGAADVFEDQYISSGGQMVELVLGHDRFCCDLRPLFYEIVAKTAGETVRGLECHPYDVAGALVARESGILLTDGFGQPLDCSLNVHQGVHWCGYANASIQRQVQPAINGWLEEHGVTPR